jgi:DNA-binding transcriptional LysR family regulator
MHTMDILGIGMRSDIKAFGKRVDLNLMVVFDAVYRARNLSTAGQTLGLSQPAMSHALARLRSLVKDPLFVRLPRGLQPTPYADTIAAAVAQGLGTIRGVFTETGFDPATSKRVFHVAMTDIGEHNVLPKICAHLATHAPGVGIETVQPNIKELRDALATGVIDLAAGVIPEFGTGFRHQTIARNSYVCMVREGHPTIRHTLTLKLFREARHVLVSSQASTATGHAEHIEQAVRKAAGKEKIAVRNAHYLALPALIMSTDLVATVPGGLAVAFRENVKLRIFPPPFAMPNFEARVYWHERYDREPGNRWLRGLFPQVSPRA